MLRLHRCTDPRLTDVILSDFDAFLVDHAACERKASAFALSLVTHYPDRRELVREMVRLAQEELEHFAQVVGWIDRRGLVLGPDEKDPYVGGMHRLQRKGSRPFFLDRLLVAGIVEARGCERFSMVANALPAGDLKAFYEDIARSEARHHGLFVRLARVYFPDAEVTGRLEELLCAEAQLIERLPLRARLH